MALDQVINCTRNVILADRVEVAGTWLRRLKGLLGRNGLPGGHCLIIVPCKSVHTHFMKFNIDVLFADSSGRVVHMIENMPPFRFGPVVKNAFIVVELPAQTIADTGTSLSDHLNIKPGDL